MTTPTILLVDDEPLVREIIRGYLERAGYTVVEAAGGEEALALAADSDAAFVLAMIDVRLGGGMDGVELARALRRARPAIPILLVSGDPGDESFGDLLGEKGTMFLRKPFTRSVLLDHVTRVRGEGRS